MDVRIRAGIIPHANKKYCGNIRKKVFTKINNHTDYIIYIVALHKIQKTNDIYLVYKSNDFPDLDIKYKDINYIEHSFEWVKNELLGHFKKAKILAIAPNINIDYKLISKKISKFLIKYPNSCLLATTDLTHYGDIFDNIGSLMFPEQQNKIIIEENLIQHLIIKPIIFKNIKTILLNSSYLTCGTYAILLFTKIIEILRWSGKVVDYYDSYGSQKKDYLDRYIISPNKINSFVSYVGIIYGSHIDNKKISSFDIYQALGLIKSNIIFNTLGLSNKLKLPIWSPFYKNKNGVFIGTNTPDGKTNCCYGRFEDGLNMADKINNASLDCFKDAKTRWNIPYKIPFLNKYIYKLELLDSMKKWSKIHYSDIYSKFKLDGTQGVYLILPNGNISTFLPIVIKDNPKWNINTYMSHLSLKAGGNKLDWEKGTIYIYSSKEYKWNSIKQKLE